MYRMSSKHREPTGRPVEELRFRGVGSRKGADSSFATQTPKESVRYMETHRHLYQYNILPDTQPQKNTHPQIFQRERQKCSEKCPDVREKHLYPTTCFHGGEDISIAPSRREKYRRNSSCFCPSPHPFLSRG